MTRSRRQLRSMDSMLRGFTPSATIATLGNELDIDAIVKDFNEKWAIYSSIKNSEVK